jgi:hypothetical protein
MSKEELFLMMPIYGGRGVGPGVAALTPVASNRAMTLANKIRLIFLFGISLS